MSHPLLFLRPAAQGFAVTLLVALAGCGQDAAMMGAENSATENVQVTLPPSIKASHPYRCKANSAGTIHCLQDGVTLPPRSASTISQLHATPPREASTDGKHTVDGDGPTIALTRPGKEPETCKM